MKRKEILIFSLILCICLMILGGRWIKAKMSGPSAGYIKITARGKDFGIYSLAEDQTIYIMETNICEIKDGECKMTIATCPATSDSACIYQDPIKAPYGGIITCLPNNVIIEYTDEPD